MNTPTPDPTPIARLAAMLGAAACCLGCGGGGGSEYADFENSFELRQPSVEVPLGSYSVPVPVTSTNDSGGLIRSNLLQLKFTLHGLVKPEVEAEMLRLTERHTGRLRDAVIKICRNASVDDLIDPQLSTLRARILDTVQPLLDGASLQRVLVTDRMLEPL